MDCFAALAMTLKGRANQRFRPCGMQNGIASSLALFAVTSLTSPRKFA
jgi:hypothetical protein